LVFAAAGQMKQMKKSSLESVSIGRFHASGPLLVCLVAIFFVGKVGFAQPGPQPTVQVRPGLSIGENTVADVAQAAAPSVVNVEVAFQSTIPKPVVKGGQGNPFNEKAPPQASSKPGLLPKVIGSGLIVRADGYIVTNYHLVRHADDGVQVTLNDERAFKAKVIGTDYFTDLAVLKIDAKDLHTIPFALGKKVRPGEWAIAIGNPFGYDHTVTLGIVSAAARALSDGSNHADMIQTDAAINTGNSGGPLLNIHGEVIGLTSSMSSKAQNIAFAIPAEVVNQVATTLIEKGSTTKPYAMERPYLGFYMKDWDNRIITNPNLPSNVRGVILIRIIRQSPAEKTGLMAGDFVTKVSGTSVNNVKEIRAITRQRKPGDVLVIEGSRNGKAFSKKLTVGKYPEDEPWVNP
jgi:serine protease Do